MAGKPKLSEAQKQKLIKYAIFVLMAIVCAGCFWLIFAPSDEDIAKEQIGMGFNVDIPDPKKDGIVGDKMSAYEQEQTQQRQKDRMQSLQGYADMLENSKSERVTINMGDDQNYNESVSTPKAPINNSVSAYRDINRTLGNFYEKPKDDPEKEEMKRKLEELEAKMQEKDDKQSAVDEQLLLMEKSYEMAAKYMPQGQNQETPNNSLKNRIDNYGKDSSSKNGKTPLSPVRQIQKNTVSSLAQNVSNSELYRMYDQPRNMSFNTMDGEIGINTKNTISAVIHDDQTIIDGQTTRLRLTEPLVAGMTLIPENTILTGIAKVQGERLDILISSIEYEGTIIPVEMLTYDTDGQKGIHIPGSLEMNAAKEIVANMGNSIGSSFTMTQSTGAQLASDLNKGAIQGVSAYMQKKIRQVKVTLKSGYRVMLMPKQ
ncbi:MULTISPECIES: conjugative transposon protein TraM [Dysgonomonas]|uniref:conjugative transposon protein TraM n=1 Tax=Dysgonomonas TaxID=156973 RepID=UPI000925CC65|nr:MULTISPECIES: conjugative transposon protein TraM [Dysgonomonas]MBN9300558.1 conjugative transposon protein TraM [Dysgonomonas mossii]OJX56138.1 MAG: conjugative transposon protein TraM [Dysgonomonas sp. 37-18]